MSRQITQRDRILKIFHATSPAFVGMVTWTKHKHAVMMIQVMMIQVMCGIYHCWLSWSESSKPF